MGFISLFLTAPFEANLGALPNVSTTDILCSRKINFKDTH
jgi:hypothetical protein